MYVEMESYPGDSEGMSRLLSFYFLHQTECQYFLVKYQATTVVTYSVCEYQVTGVESVCRCE